jgi:hypothetical protein
LVLPELSQWAFFHWIMGIHITFFFRVVTFFKSVWSSSSEPGIIQFPIHKWNSIITLMTSTSQALVFQLGRVRIP